VNIDGWTNAEQPDLSCARDVLAFLLVPAGAFFRPGEYYLDVVEILNEAKREALLSWYRERKVLS
jgi:hypothetical protein